jgi:uncharacterized damage-inducible protein DinB
LCEAGDTKLKLPVEEKAMNELQEILVGMAAATPPGRIVGGLTDEVAHRKPAGAPHSIYEEAWHVAYWLEMTLDWVSGRPTPYPAHAAQGFPTVLDMEREDWMALCVRLTQGLTLAARLAGKEQRLEVKVECPSQPGMPTRWMTVREQLENLGAHNAYHLGRIVLLRQLLDAWPPASGGDTW